MVELAGLRSSATIPPDLLPVYNDLCPNKNVTLLGSFKGFNKIVAYREIFKDLGYHVLAPEGKEITHFANTFEVLDADAVKLARLEEHVGWSFNEDEIAIALEGLFVQAIRASDFCYVIGTDRSDIDDGGYLGTLVASEIGLALALGKPVYGTAISPTLDEREGYRSNFWAYSSLIRVAEPHEIITG